jgi:hypothetical protein|tara:strand:- start:21 stop:242 length:222 start_codon:yes stop_codon:yes gene_type:complete
MFYNVSEYLEFDNGKPIVSGVVENISTLNRLKPWISDLIQNQVYHGQEMSCELTTEYDHRSDVYNFKLIFEKC